VRVRRLYNLGDLASWAILQAGRFELEGLCELGNCASLGLYKLSDLASWRS